VPAVADPLRTSLEEQLRKMRGGGELPPSLLDVRAEQVGVGGRDFVVVRPRDWDELRHQEGGDGRSVPYWALMWPSGRALADALENRDLRGRRVLELGCGLALPSLVAAGAGASVLATDGCTDAAVFAAHNLALNELEGEVAVVDWRERHAFEAGAPWDLVLAADVLYLRQNVEALLRLLPRLIGVGGEALIADPSRSGGREFVTSAKRIFSLETTSAAGYENVNVHRLRPSPR
jgi:predicted nicotinamide N-methyase